ncbi:M3 family oligoendopeptidase [Sutcliffiella rhizosphaerae]|uniref:Oligoendopeptidase F, plasmid n=1 Tax=Sutcliffiella rhizosphaerae TaxID=2880967 RepID=A0ABN8A8F9_9BACI|nr:M3 family oligoendopeptidase [Sutcliffiella rhizosphaerae]CAG9619398.1 Oligoendopeptidase F, plasmid [Sutcliffiella rhizosphaerae]
MATKTYSETWDLDVFFNGGSKSEDFHTYLDGLHSEISAFGQEIEAFSADSLEEVLGSYERVVKKVVEASAFISCLLAQDVKDKQASQLQGKVAQLHAKLQVHLGALDEKLVDINDSSWSNLLQTETFAPLEYVLNERRRRAGEKLPAAQEKLVTSLAVDGYHAWGKLYNSIVGSIKIPVEENGETKELSVGQAHNRFSNGDRTVRKEVSKAWQEAWEEQSETIAAALNHLAGFRLQVYEQRGWDSVLKEPLENNRMKQETVDTMWQVITDHKDIFKQYLARKAELLGLEKLNMYDVSAPLSSEETILSYQEGAEFITEQFSKFGPELTSFTEKAFEDRWIEAEDRAGKRPGGFCTSFPVSGQSRIFMTYSGTLSNVSTLAHELGHAFHQHAMHDVPTLNRFYASNVAETASTFAEMIVADAAVKYAKDEMEKISLLEDKIQRSVAFYMNIHARFLFETRFYEERKKGLVSVEKLNDLMVEAQKEAYCGALDEYDHTFWASKMHFFITQVPFYNFPYTFGYLFSLGIYSQALEEGANYEEKYIALLKDTASMTVEDLAMKHLGVDLTERDFWEKAVQKSLEDVEEFLQLTNK